MSALIYVRSVAALYELFYRLKPLGLSVVDANSTFLSLFFDIIDVALLLLCGGNDITYKVDLLLLFELVEEFEVLEVLKFFDVFELELFDVFEGLRAEVCWFSPARFLSVNCWMSTETSEPWLKL